MPLDHAATTTRTTSVHIAIACGGTAGHVYPGLAVASAWQRMAPGTDIFFIGTADGFEARLVPQHGHRLVTVPAAPYARTGAAGKARAVAATVEGVLAARRLLRSAGVDLVLGLGGYASLPAMLAAWTLGVPTLLHEANAVAGRANRVAGRVADGVLLAFESAAAEFPSPGVLTGVPVREEIVRVGAAPHPLRAGDVRRVLVAGGSGGSPFLDARVPDLLSRVGARGPRITVRHQVGVGNVATARAAYAAVGIPADVVAYVDDMAAAYAWADFVVTCAGAVTLAELAVAGVPALVVPLARAAFDHQTANARAFAAVTAMPWSSEADWDPAPLAERVASVLGSEDAWLEASATIRRAGRDDAAEAVVRACLAHVRNGAGADTRGL